jgi:lipopolysaccharide/colanic/teichoic acid biosynthesis glycosyltransferase
MEASEAVRAPLWKRLEDLIFAIPALIALLPVFALIAIAIRLEDNGPVFFSDERVGAGGHPFRMLKFRTMVPAAIGHGLGRLVAARDDRITGVGAVLRRFSLDELPQVLNVVRGSMSLVGPRPTFPAQVSRYTARHRGRLRAKPGLTGLAQISGRNDLPWNERIELDLRYIQQMSLLLDLAILIRTPFVVLSGRGLYGRGGITPDYESEADQR